MKARRPVDDYLARRGSHGPWSLDVGAQGPFPGGIIIPSFAEASELLGLLASLSADFTLAASGLAVVIVVNHRGSATAAEKVDDARSLAFLDEAAPALAFPLLIIDAASPGLELPEKDGGVGLARKIGHDLLLPHLDYGAGDPLLISLDADTRVEPGYAGALCRHFAGTSAGGAAIPFAHREGSGERENAAIVRYELFLRCYVAGLAFAGSPYGFHTVGSAMACTASAYVKAGGMSRRKAGEDFYFLQELAKTSGVAPVQGALVLPSPRRSHRVPFGTGRSMMSLLDGDPSAVLFHRPEAFFQLREWLALAGEGCRTGDANLPARAARVSPELAAFLEQQGFDPTWARLTAQNRTAPRLERAFHGWFDGFRTMKFLHFLAEGPLPRGEPAEIVSAFPEAWGASGMTLLQRLEFLRGRQGRTRS